jgi:uncharacterized protein (DUF885 family)
MKSTLVRVLVLVVLTYFIAMPSGTAAEASYAQGLAAVNVSKGKSSEHDRLWKLFDLHWNYLMTEYPEWATSVGYPGQNGRWTDMSFEAIARRKRELQLVRKTIASIDAAKLSPADKLNYQIFKYRNDMAVSGSRFPDELLALNQLEGPQQSAAMTIVQNPALNMADYENILSRLRGVPKVVNQTIDLLKEGVKKGVVPPKVTLRDVPRQIKTQIVTDATASSLYEPFKKFPDSIPVAEQERLRRIASGVILNEVVPSYKKMLDYFVTTYEPACRDSLALTDLPEGKDWYAHRASSSTTTNKTPAEIHNIGLAEVKRLRGEMDAVIAKTGFKGSFQEFCNFLRTDPQFFFGEAKDLLVAYRDIAKRIDPELVKQFGRLPRLPYGIEPVPAFSEQSQPTAYYRPGTLNPGRPGLFFANTYDLKSRPKWEMEALTMHEAVPGHHLQIALAQEFESLPNFRKHGDFTAYVEGWGLYAESLGYDMGMYKDPYSRFGQLTYDMWRAIRLVLDTGIHSMGWSRQQAIDFFKENSSKSQHDIEVEVDRYIVWPGQALAYKIGQLAFKDLKQQAKRELGDKFDVRAFHDHTLSLGAVPLDVLKTQTTQWINETKTRKSANAELKHF